MPDFEVTTLGEPRPVDVAAVERELTQLWRSASDGAPGGPDQPVMRACTLNLLVFLRGEEDSRRVAEVVGKLTVQHPCRAIVVNSQPEDGRSELVAWITAQCHLPAAGGKQVCCEQIMVSARGESVAHLPGVVIPLLLADLPVFLWWRDSQNLGGELFKKLAAVCDRVIIDSSTFQSPQAELAKMVSTMRSPELDIALGDLNWSRLRPWREFTAQLFDSPDGLLHLKAIDKVIIEYEGSSRKTSTLPTQPLVLAGWFASRVGWKPLPYRHRVEGLHHHLLLQTENSQAHIEIRMAKHSQGSGEVNSFCLQSSQEPSQSFLIGSHGTLGRPEEYQYLEAEISRSEGGCLQIVHRRPLDEAVLMGEQLDILGHDSVYEEALAVAAALSTW
jgi:glucose-6-phosphate dehydrogenase assembly protein OpcA